MLTIGYEQKDRSVKYLFTSDDLLETLLTDVVYPDKPLPTKIYERDELKETNTVKEYFAKELSDEEDTRFRLLRKLDESWLIRDSYGSTEHDIVISKTNVKNGGKKKKTRSNKNSK